MSNTCNPDPSFQELPSDEREALRKAITAFLGNRDEIVFAYLHGSFAHGSPFRDIDLALYIDEKRLPGGSLEEYKEQIQNQLSHNFHNVFDITLMNLTPFWFNLPVFAEGELLFSRDEDLRTDLIESCSLSSITDEGLSVQSLKELVF